MKKPLKKIFLDACISKIFCHLQSSQAAGDVAQQIFGRSRQSPDMADIFGILKKIVNFK